MIFFFFFCQKMNTATSESRKTADSAPEEKGDRVRLKKQLGLLEGVAIILGIIFGSGKYLDKIIYYCFFGQEDSTLDRIVN